MCLGRVGMKVRVMVCTCRGVSQGWWCWPPPWPALLVSWHPAPAEHLVCLHRASPRYSAAHLQHQDRGGWICVYFHHRHDINGLNLEFDQVQIRLEVDLLKFHLLLAINTLSLFFCSITYYIRGENLRLLQSLCSVPTWGTSPNRIALSSTL